MCSSESRAGLSRLCIGYSDRMNQMNKRVCRRGVRNYDAVRSGASVLFPSEVETTRYDAAQCVDILRTLCYTVLTHHRAQSEETSDAVRDGLPGADPLPLSMRMAREGTCEWATL
jgi:hypothetical protein